MAKLDRHHADGPSQRGAASGGSSLEAEAAARGEVLSRILAGLPGCIVAFSGGVDSAFLLKMAHDLLGDRVLAVTAVSASLAAAELEEARALARFIGCSHRLVRTGELSDPRYARNDEARCYYCKSELFDILDRVARVAAGRPIVYGAIVDDLGDDRPGMRAAAERGVRAPLIEAGLTKAMIRILSRRLGLPTWDKPAMACLASRIPRHTQVTAARLALVERAEAGVHRLGYRQVRVRMTGPETARIELDPSDLTRALEPAESGRLLAAVREAGFRDASIDPLGYRPARGVGPVGSFPSP